MDQLTVIVAVMTAILFSWVGYFLGNLFPFMGKKLSSIRENKKPNDRMTVGKLFNNIKTYFSDRDKEEVDQIEEGVPLSMGVHQPEKLISQTGLKDLNRIWYDKSERKLYAEHKGSIINLDEELTPEQHSYLSFLILDLQDKVGISAKLRSVVAEREGEAFPEEEDDKLVPPSFHPIKSFMQYIQADAPKLEEKPDSIPVQINEILQNKLKGTPLQSLGISISEWPNKGVVFIVGVEVYDEIRQIPDSQIRHIVREAVKEWESRERED